MYIHKVKCLFHHIQIHCIVAMEYKVRAKRICHKSHHPKGVNGNGVCKVVIGQKCRVFVSLSYVHALVAMEYVNILRMSV